MFLGSKRPAPGLALVALLLAPSATDAESFTRIENRWKPDHYVHIEKGPVAAGPVQPGWWSAQWTLEEVPDTPYRRIRNRWKPDHYVHVENGPVSAGPIQPGWWSAQWTLEPVPGTPYHRLRNRWKPDLALHIQNGRLEAGTVQPGWWSAMWSLEGPSVAGQSAPPPTPEADPGGAPPVPAVAPPDASGVPTGTPVYLRASDQPLYLHTWGGSQSGGHNTLHACPKQNDHGNCQWILERSPTRPGAYYLRASDQPLYLHTSGGSQPGGHNTLHPCPKQNDHPNCQWILEPSSTRPGAYYLRSADRSLYLHTSGGSAVGNHQTLHPCPKANDHGNCQWVLESSGGASVATTSGSRGSAPAPGGGELAYLRGVGTVPDRCGPGEGYEAGLCYDACRSGYAGGATICAQTCPGGFRDDGLFCAKPSSYGRGAGYPWEFGDTAFSLDDARSRCRRENSQGCEKHGEIIYPKCRSGFKPVGCCVCSPVCPGGMTDIGVSCAKKTYDRGVGRVPTSCGPGEVNEAGLCYEPCRGGYVGVGPSCFAELDPATLEKFAREAERKWNETRREMQPVVDVVEAHLTRMMRSPPGPERVAQALRSGGHEAIARMFDIDGLRAALQRAYVMPRVGRVGGSRPGSERARPLQARSRLQAPLLPSADRLLARLLPGTWLASTAGAPRFARGPARPGAVQVASAPIERSILLLLPNIDIGLVASAAADWGFAFPIHDSTGGAKCIRSQSWALGLTAGLDSAPLGFGVCDAAPKDLAGTGHGFGGGASAAAGGVIQAYFDYGEGWDALGRGQGPFGDFQCFTLQGQVGASAEIEYVRGQTQVDEPITCVP